MHLELIKADEPVMLHIIEFAHPVLALRLRAVAVGGRHGQAEQQLVELAWGPQSWCAVSAQGQSSYIYIALQVMHCGETSLRMLCSIPTVS